jgi:hypothetical protein
MKSSNREKIKEINEQQLQARLKVLTTPKETERNPIDDIIEGPTDSEVHLTQPTAQQSDITTDIIHETKDEDCEAERSMIETEIDVTTTENLSSLQNRFGVRKIKRPVKDAQLTARIESVTLKRFKEIVKTMYYPDKPNINETVTQIIRAFVAEYDKNNGGKK